jgi:hypothetical protein
MHRVFTIRIMCSIMPSAGSMLDAIASTTRWFDRAAGCSLAPDREAQATPDKTQPMRQPSLAPDEPIPTDVPIPDPHDVPVPEPKDVPPPTPRDPYVPTEPRPIP